jgi:hypothetical protein
MPNNNPPDPATGSTDPMLLRLIDARFETMSTKVDGVGDGVKALADSVAALNARYDQRFEDHEARLHVIEAEMVVRKLQVVEFNELKSTVASHTLWIAGVGTTTKTSSKIGEWFWNVFKPVIIGIAAWAATGWMNSPTPVVPSHQVHAVAPHTAP